MSKKDTKASSVYTYAARWTCHCGESDVVTHSSDNKLTAAAMAIVTAVVEGQEHQDFNGCAPTGVHIEDMGKIDTSDLEEE